MFATDEQGKSAEILYIHASKQGVGSRYMGVGSDVPFWLIPVGVIGMLNLLSNEGIDVCGINEPLERLLDARFNLAHWLHRLQRVRMVLVDLHWYEHCYGAIEVCRLCREVLPGVPIIVGGLTATRFADEILKDFPCIDIIIQGDGEEPLRQLACALCLEQRELHDVDLAKIPNLAYRKSNQVVMNSIDYCATSDQIDHMDWVSVGNLLHSREYRGLQYVGEREAYAPAEGPPHLGHWLTVGRGCRFDCSYCGGGSQSHRALAGREGLVFRSVASIAHDLERLSSEGVHQVALTLDLSLMGKAYWSRLFAEISRRRVEIGIYNEVFLLPKPDFVRAFAEAANLAHSELALSVLSQENVRRRNGKNFRDTQLFRALTLLKQHRVPISVYFSLNLPGETLECFPETLELAAQIGRVYPSELLRMLGQPNTIDPESPMSRHPEEYDLELSFRSFSHYYSYCRRTANSDTSPDPLEQHGFHDLHRSRDETVAIRQAWHAFCMAQTFECT